MGSLTFQLVGDGTVGTKTKTYTISDADVNRFVAWAQHRYDVGPPPVGVTLPLTITQALVVWADQVVANAKNGIQQYESQVAAAGVSAITTT